MKKLFFVFISIFLLQTTTAKADLLTPVENVVDVVSTTLQVGVEGVGEILKAVTVAPVRAVSNIFIYAVTKDEVTIEPEPVVTTTGTYIE